MDARKKSPNKPSILLVERDVLVRTPLAAYLRECGYIVIESGSGEEAMLVLQQQQLRVDVLLTDADLPGPLDVFSLVQKARASRADVRTLIAATPERAAALAGKLCDDDPLLSKPYASQRVADRIRQLLAFRGRSDLSDGSETD
jgi:DNA-binding response OmpR family regulator